MMPGGSETYRNYVSNHLGRIYHCGQDEYELYCRYFRTNYLHFLPTDRQTPVLDIGCGLGHFLYFLKMEGFTNRTAVDMCAEALEQCVARELVTRDRAVHADARMYLQSQKSTFGAIVMNDVIEHIEKQAIIPMLAASKDALRPGGVLIIKTFNAANPVVGSSSRYLDFTHTVGFTEESLRFVCYNAGFTNVVIHSQNIWVFNPFVNVVGHAIQQILKYLFRALYLVYGRRSTRIFTKDLIAVAFKEA